MRGFFSKVLFLIPIIVGGGYLYTQRANQKAQEEIALALVEARKQFATQVNAVVSHDSETQFRSALRTALHAYEKSLEDIYVDRKKWFDLEAQKKVADASLEAGDISEAQHRNMLEGYHFVRAAYDTLLSGQWTSNLSARGQGATRLDVYGLKRIRGPDGHPLLEARFFLWGIEPKTPTSFGRLTLEYWEEAEPDARTKRRRRRAGEDPDAPVLKPLGRAEGDATPIIFVQDPSSRVAQFPSNVAIGMVWFPQVPREAKVMDLKYEYTVRRNGQTHRSPLTWDKHPIPSEWRLPESEPWIADEVEATEDEMKSVDPVTGEDS